jgi:uncharacterized protein (DUF58 family)
MPIRHAQERPPDARAPLLEPALMARVRQIRIRTHRLVNTALSGGYRSTFRGAGMEFQEVREYQPGDEVRRIDWNVTARTGHPFVKTYAEERELTLDFVVDTSRSMDFGSRARTKRETAAQFCALIGFVAIQHQDRIGLALFGERPLLHLRPRKGTRHALRVIREVIAAPASARRTDLAAALEHELRGLRRRSLVFVVSDFLAPAAPGVDWSEPLARLARRHDVIAVRVHDPLESELPRGAWIELEELERGAASDVDARSAAVRAQWAEAARARRAELSATLARARVDLIEVATDGDIAQPVLAFFRRRMSRYGGRR